ncbi:MAG: hypothetical protein OXC41_08610 [Gammaproteobacteria bacterium]|nr:hypothetical protein [Gammaproteobacteria bacterium]
MKYKLETDVSEFIIRQEPLGLWDLWVDSMPTRTFLTPEDAAKAVHEQDSGYIIWDQLKEHDAPPDLSGWEKLDKD